MRRSEGGAAGVPQIGGVTRQVNDTELVGYGEGFAANHHRYAPGGMLAAVKYYTGSPSSHTALIEDLASHGYIVLSIVHPYEAAGATRRCWGDPPGCSRASRGSPR